MLRTEGPNRVSTPQVTTLHGTEVTVPQKERGAPLSIARDIGSIAGYHHGSLVKALIGIAGDGSRRSNKGFRRSSDARDGK